MQPVLTRASVLDDPDRSDPPDVFCSLGSLIVEGRVPANDDRGYGEGPHVPPSRNVPIPRHECSEDNFMVCFFYIEDSYMVYLYQIEDSYMDIFALLRTSLWYVFTRLRTDIWNFLQYWGQFYAMFLLIVGQFWPYLRLFGFRTVWRTVLWSFCKSLWFTLLT